MGKSSLLVVVGALWLIALTVAVVLRVDGTSEDSVEQAVRTEDRWTDDIQELRRRVDMAGAATPADPELLSRIEELEDRVKLLEGGGFASAPAPAAVPKPADFELSEEAAGLPLEDLAIQARMYQGRRDYGTAAAYWRAILDRNPDDKQKQEALYNLGVAYRRLKDHAREERVFRDWAAFEGRDTQGEMSAFFQVAWSLYYQEKFPEALEVMERVARSDMTHDATRPYALIHAASFAAKVGDYARARPIVVQLIADYEKSEDQSKAWILKRARELLQEIDGG